jgi:hypothetical protein
MVIESGSNEYAAILFVRLEHTDYNIKISSKITLVRFDKNGKDFGDSCRVSKKSKTNKALKR